MRCLCLLGEPQLLIRTNCKRAVNLEVHFQSCPSHFICKMHCMHCVQHDRSIINIYWVDDTLLWGLGLSSASATKWANPYSEIVGKFILIICIEWVIMLPKCFHFIWHNISPLRLPELSFFQDRNLARLRQTDQTYHAFAQHKQNLSELGTIGSCVICSLTQEHGRRHIVTFLHVQLLSRCNTNSSHMDKTVKLT